MDNQPTGSINIDRSLMNKIGYLLKRLRQPNRHSNDTLEQTRECLAQMIDWVDAIFTDAQLRAAVDLLGERHELSRPPAFFPDMTNPMGTILSHSAENLEKL